MARIKYYYNTETCTYERAKVTFGDVALNLLGFLSVALVFAVVILLIHNTYFDTPVEAQLRKENKELKEHYASLSVEMNEVNEVIETLAERDDNIYRKIYEAEPLGEEIRMAGTGGADRYKRIMEAGLEDEQLVKETFQRIDKLKQKASIQNQSFDQLMRLASSKKHELTSIPAIEPIKNENLTNLVSGYGMRINPFHKGRTKHEGIDYAAPRGTEVYATADGTVSETKDNSYLETGYGNYVEIDHGNGYITKYAHLDALLVKNGETVKRGDLIGRVGNSGGSAAPHLHYEVIKDNIKINPIYFLINGVSDADYAELTKLASRENQSFD